MSAASVRNLTRKHCKFSTFDKLQQYQNLQDLGVIKCTASTLKRMLNKNKSTLQVNTAAIRGRQHLSLVSTAPRRNQPAAAAPTR